MTTTTGIPENLTVLIVDADRCIRLMLTEIFRVAGYLVLAAASAQEAVAITAGERIGLIVADGGLATPAGRRLVRALATPGRARSGQARSGGAGPGQPGPNWPDKTERGDRADVPVVLLSSSGHMLKASDLAGLGVQMILSKPFSRRELLAGVAEMLGVNESDRGAPA